MKLTKWYYDLVTADGQAFIGYSAQLRLFGISIPWRACYMFQNNQVELRQGLGRSRTCQTDDGYSLEIPKLNVAGFWHASDSVPPQQVLATENLSIEWQGLSTKAQVVLNTQNQQLHGFGYCEKMTLELKKPQLPFHELYWGRFISHDGAKSISWIQFDGKYSRCLVFEDSTVILSGQVTEQHVKFDQQNLSLKMHGTLVECDIKQHVPFWLEKLAGGSIVSGREQKWLSHGIFTDKNGTEYTGWAIHENVTW